MNKLQNTPGRRGILIIFFLLGIILLPLCVSVYPPGPGLDPSWVIGLQMISDKGGHFGSDIAFTYGPFGHLFFGDYSFPNLYFLSLLTQLFLFAIILVSFTFLLIYSLANWKDCILVLVMLFFLIPHLYEYTAIIASGILLYLLIMQDFKIRTEVSLIVFIAAVMGFTSLMKFQILVANLAMITLILLILALKKDWRRFKLYLLLPGIFTLFFLFYWLVAGQQLSDLLSFILNGIQSASGYSEAMAAEYGPSWHILLGVGSIILFIALFLYAFIRNIKDLNIFLVIFSAILFLSFKHGFIRHDAHVIPFFAVYGIISLSCYLVTKRSMPNNIRVIFLLMTVVFIMAIAITIPGVYGEEVIWKEENFYRPGDLGLKPLTILYNQSYRDQELEWARADIGQYYPIANTTLEYIGLKSIDSFPGDIALLWANDLNWSPRPTINSVTAYTSQLDYLNARHFSGADAPAIVLYRYDTIDNRYPLFDEPATFATVLQEYDLVETDGDFLILSHQSAPKSAQQEDLGSIVTNFGEVVPIPEYTSGYIFAHIALDYSPYGRMMQFIYKPSQVYLRFQYRDSSLSRAYRLIPGPAKNGLFVSQFVGSTEDLITIFSNNIQSDLSGIILYAEQPSQFERTYSVQFKGVPSNITHMIKIYTMPEWEQIEEVPGGAMNIDLINGNLISNQFETIKLSDNQLVTFEGWAIDDQAKTGDVSVFLVFQGEGEELIIPTQKSIRKDVAEYFDEKNYTSSGWIGTVPSEKVRDHCFFLSVRIIPADGNGFYQPGGNVSVCFS